ncbi:FMN-binding protein [Rathayibacter sp. KR2-224]|uniref:FMN-binding protein n=1 Tax=Rathayibacter sp. KR2-224 TaxID=3400913 RepID=UPI003BFD92C7
MKKIIYGLLATVTGTVLLLSYRTSLEVVNPTASTGTGSSTSGSGSSAQSGSTGTTQSGSTSSSSTPSSTPSASSSSSSGLKDGTYTGQAADTRYGAVQVKVTVSGGKITAVDVPQYPTESFRDEEINRQAVPQLVSETLKAQSSSIDMVSGATYTSEGYLQSLQSALDGARA